MTYFDLLINHQALPVIEAMYCYQIIQNNDLSLLSRTLRYGGTFNDYSNGELLELIEEFDKYYKDINYEEIERLYL